ncbi:YqaA family protein [Amphritea pacifica]|uniref:DedA family protein n=1 Tax=Amphritea pacifica TaxID=2811233 RepID=A0ABS2WBM8_9GAMM|nr:DedA family protein [Amphritea pacifica]MBN0988978.1 DedA family protein [Amphritea pacifica]
MADLGVWGLFVSSFISATLMPGGSEVLLGYLLTQPDSQPQTLLLAASVGNSLGGIVTFAMGWWVAVRWPLLQPEKRARQRALRVIQSVGPTALLLSWLPVIGDPLCFAAGWFRCHLLLSLVLITLGKTLRFLFIVLAFS